MMFMEVLLIVGVGGGGRDRRVWKMMVLQCHQHDVCASVTVGSGSNGWTMVGLDIDDMAGIVV